MYNDIEVVRNIGQKIHDDVDKLRKRNKRLESKIARLQAELMESEKQRKKLGDAYMEILKENQDINQTVPKLEAELAELKALHVTKRAVAMQAVCEAAKSINYELIDRAIDLVLGEWGDSGEYNELTEKIRQLQHALRRLAEVKGD